MNGDFWAMLGRELKGYMADGGPVMVFLALGTIVLWAGLGYRILNLRRGTKMSPRLLVQAFQTDPDRDVSGFVDLAAKIAVNVRRNNKGNIRRILDDELFPLTAQMSRYRSIVRTIVVIAPLLGLLGTVSGMIEMFSSLGNQTFYSQSGGVANGISQALFTTQFGLVVSIPGMLVGLMLDRRERAMNEDIEQIKEILITEKKRIKK